MLAVMSVRWEKTGSSKGMLDDAALDVSCPACGASISATIGQARKSPTVRCRNGHDVKLNASDLDKGIRDVEKGLDGLFE